MADVFAIDDEKEWLELYAEGLAEVGHTVRTFEDGSEALDDTGWNKARASEKLGIFPSSLYKKMKRFGIPQKRPE